MKRLKVYSMTDEEWWIAESEELAIQDYRDTFGVEPDRCEELSDSSLQSEVFGYEDGTTGSFEDERQMRESNPHIKAEPFASTDW